MLPLARVKKLIKAQDGVKLASTEAIFLIGRATVSRALRGQRVRAAGAQDHIARIDHLAAAPAAQAVHCLLAYVLNHDWRLSGQAHPISPGMAGAAAAAAQAHTLAKLQVPTSPLTHWTPSKPPATPQELILEDMVAKAHASMSRDGRKALLYKDICEY